jgi:iron complex transport system permease protein
MKAGSAAGMALGLLGVSLLLMGLGLCVGSAGFELGWWPGAGAQPDTAQGAVAWQIVADIRAPRSLGAWLAGALLGLAGALAQALFRNPLADPFLLGSASGASLGVALAVVLLGQWASGTEVQALGAGSLALHLGLTGAAFAGALGAVLLTVGLARGVQQTLRLLLAGVVVGVVLGAATQLVLLSSPQAAQTLQAFMLGSTAWVSWLACALMAVVLVLGLVLALALGRALDALSLGEATAHSLGLPLRPLRLVLVLVLALLTATAVAQTGLIAFVGLAAPHVVRSLSPSPYARLLGLSSLMGGVLLLGADLLARWVWAPQELPVGLLTAVLGGGYLLWLMRGGGGPRGGGA